MLSYVWDDESEMMQTKRKCAANTARQDAKVAPNIRLHSLTHIAPLQLTLTVADIPIWDPQCLSLTACCQFWQVKDLNPETEIQLPSTRTVFSRWLVSRVTRSKELSRFPLPTSDRARALLNKKKKVTGLGHSAASLIWVIFIKILTLTDFNKWNFIPVKNEKWKRIICIWYRIRDLSSHFYSLSVNFYRIVCVYSARFYLQLRKIDIFWRK